RKLEKSSSLTRADQLFRSNSREGQTVVSGSGRKLPQRQRSNESNWTSGVSDVSVSTFGTLSDSTVHTEPLPSGPQTHANAKQLPRITAQQQAILRERVGVGRGGGVGGGVIGSNSSHTVPSIPNSQQHQLIDNSMPLNTQNFMKNQLIYSSNGFAATQTAPHLDPTGAANPGVQYVYADQTSDGGGPRLHSYHHSGNRRRSTTESVIRNDSLSSDQSECVVRPPPPKPYKVRNRSGKKLRPYSSFSSSDEEIRSTPDPSTEDDLDIESESISEKGEHIDHNLHKCQRILKPEEILDAKIKKFLAHPITWKPSTNGTHLIGHMILKKHLADDTSSSSSATILGLKVVGGRIIESGRLGAIVEKVKKGSIADTIGRLRPGDEVVEWNGRSLQGKTYEEVYDIIAESKQEPQVELIVSRLTQKLPLATNPTPLLKEDLLIPPNRIGRRHTDVIANMGPQLSYDKTFIRGSSLGAELNRSNRPYLKVTRTSTISGRIQVKLWYDIQSLQLVVTIISAIDLSPRKTGYARNPYAKMFLLPDKSEKSKRRTKTMVNSNEPLWNQTFVYSPLRRSEMKTKALEITIWDFDRYGANEFLGEVLIELAVAPLDDEPEWYLLATHEEIFAQLRLQQKPYLTSADRISPSTSSRLSDSDISELEYDDGFNTSRESWRGLLADTSQSSIGSSGSPPLMNTVDPKPSSRHNPYNYLPQDVSTMGRRGRQGLLAEGNASSLPTNYILNENESFRYRPEFRKSSSQPTRSLSPPSLRSRSPSHSIGTPTSSVGGGHFSKKRHLPQVPAVPRRVVDSVYTGFDPLQQQQQQQMQSRNWRPNVPQRRSVDRMTGGMYSDSEITTKPVFGNRQ
ncbi:unnamed protein product, partial [Medioppia subpectinata]